MDWILLHGFVGTSQDFAPLVDALGVDARRVTAPDWPGHGARAGLRHTDDYTLAAHLRLLDDAFAQARGPVTLLGYSMGGRILQHWLRERRPTLAHGSRIILLSTGPGLADPAERAQRRVADGAVATLLRTEGVPRFLHYWHSQTMFHPMLRLPPDRLSPILRRRGACDPEGLALSLEGVGAGTVGDTWGLLGDLPAPLSLVVGELDGRYVALAREMSARMGRGAPDLIAGAGHAAHLERPAQLAALLRAG